MNTPTPAERVTLPWAQHVWDAPIAEKQRDVLLRAFAPPELDPDDRSEHVPRDVVSLAVVLDLLATRLRLLPAEPAILARAAEEAVRVGLLGGAERDVVCTRLLELSQSATAHARAAFVAAFGHEIADIMTDIARAAPPDDAAAAAPPMGAHATTQRSVARALERITQATTLVVREAEWLLTQRRARSTWQI